MRQLDWNLILFTGSSLIQEYWAYWGLPRLYYWNVKKQWNKQDEINNNNAA